MDLNTLISHTKALSWDEPISLQETPSQLDNPEGSLSLVGRIITQKAPITFRVKASLEKAWDFAIPFSLETTSDPFKFIFTFTHLSHIKRILNQPTWNVIGSLLILKKWYSDLSLNEISFDTAPFWIQIHDLSLKNMNCTNAAAIGLGIGKLLKVENLAESGFICHSYQRILVEIEVSCPLRPGFLHAREGGAPSWCQLKYERLGDYCISCGLLGHIVEDCRASTDPTVPKCYEISLRAKSFSSFKTAGHPGPQRSTKEKGDFSTPSHVLPQATELTQSQITLFNPNSTHPPMQAITS